MNAPVLMEISKETIKNYWEDKLPQIWYSKKEYGTEEYWAEVEYKRYHLYYSYLPEMLKFEEYKGKHVLEIGCGVGTDTLQFARAGANVSGIDLTETAIDTCLNRFSMENLKGFFTVGDAENLPFPDNSFDFIFSFGVLHHIPNTEKCIEEIKRVLRLGGITIIMLYAKGWKHYGIRMFYHGLLKGKFFKYSPQEITNIYSEAQGNSPLTKVYSKSGVLKLFKGWSHIELHRKRMGAFFEYSHYGMPMLPYPLRWLSTTCKLEKLLGENWIIEGIK